MLELIAPLVVAVATVASTLAHAAEAVGTRRITVPADESGRAVSTMVWYPTQSAAKPEKLGENIAFFGISAIRNAAPSDGPYPLVVLSHGYGGSWRNLNWLAGELVAKGYVVAAPNHPGTTTMDRRPEEAARIWERPRDVSRVIDALSEDAAIAGDVDERRIAVIGHSLGGFTAMLAAGARFDPRRLRSVCAINKELASCETFDELQVRDDAISQEQFGMLEPDERVGAFVSLDLGLAPGLTPESLAKISVPTLIMAAGANGAKLPAKLESGYVAGFLPKETSRYVEIDDAMHFSFMQLCKPGAPAFIESVAPGVSFVCNDGGKRSREEIHRQIADEITTFLASAIPTN